MAKRLVQSQEKSIRIGQEDKKYEEERETIEGDKEEKKKEENV